MKFKIDHDLHIHTYLSLCSQDPEQTPENILRYATRNNLKRICITNHYWDSLVPGASDWYKKQDYSHIAEALPLPEAEGIEFLFGCETDMDKNFTVGIPEERYDDFDFIILPTTHMHMKDFTVDSEIGFDPKIRAELWTMRLDRALDSPLPFHKLGIAHLATTLINPSSREATMETLSLIPDSEMERLFKKAAGLGCGIELNQDDMSFSDSEADTVLRPFRIAKECGCKFYLGSDAHEIKDFDNTVKAFERAVNFLDLTEDDKFIPKKN